MSEGKYARRARPKDLERRTTIGTSNIPVLQLVRREKYPHHLRTSKLEDRNRVGQLQGCLLVDNLRRAARRDALRVLHDAVQVKRTIYR